MKNPEKQWIKMVDAAIILVMRRCLRNYLLIFFGLIWSKYCRYGVKLYIIDKSILILILVEFCTNLWKF